MNVLKKLSLIGLLTGVSLLISNPVLLSKSIYMKESPNKQLWDKADSLKDAGMPNAALDVVSRIHQIAFEAKDPPEFVKAILYDIRLRSEFEEDHLENSIAKLDTYIKQADMPAFSVLNSIQAELYFRYFSANRHTILDRTTIVGEPGSDLKTWDATAILTKSAFHYLESVKDTDELKKTPAGYFSIILEEKEESRIYRPALFDLMGHRALDFFMNPQASLIQPHDPLSLSKDIHFAEASVFANTVHERPEMLSFNYQALELFRKLTGFHLHDTSPLALIDVDIKRLQWLRANSELDEKDELFMKALQALEEKHHNTDAFPEIAYALALELQRIGNTYHPHDNPEPRLRLKDAVAKLELAIERFPKLPSTQNCRNLLQEITLPFLQVQFGSVNLPGEHFKALVSHKNVPVIHFRLISIDPETDHELKNTHRRPEDLIAAYLKLPSFKTWQQELPDDGDMQTHHTEIPFDGPPAGYYVLITGFDKYFTSRERTLPFTSFWSSKLSYISRRMEDGSMQYLVLDRENGKPLKGVKATTFTREYNQRYRRHELREWNTYKTSRDGMFTIPAPERGKPTATYVINFTHRKDRLLTDNFFSQQRFDRETPARTRTHFFTDRALYRPGQTIYFKGIVTESQGDKHEVKTNFRTTVTLLDANRRKISEIPLITNEYGSFSGSFTLPSDVLTGLFVISSQFGSVNISIEEYKLPAFEINFDTLTGSYKLGELLTINGQVRAYAGNPIAEAEVKFRVTRQARFPYFGYWSSAYIAPGSETEILNGTLKTDENGRFSITFEAVPDLLISRETNPVYIFNVKASATDIHGETQHGSTSVGVGYKALLLGNDLSGNVNRDHIREISISATNLNGKPQEVSGEITVSKLNQPSRILRERNHTRPDRFVMDKATHDKLFPHDIYDNESDPYSWSVEKQVLAGSFNTGQSVIFPLTDVAAWEPGVYVVEMKSKDAFGETVESKQHFTLFSPNDARVPENKIWWAQLLTPAVEPGDKAKVLIGSAVNLPVLFQVEINGQIVSSQRITLNRRTRLVEIPVGRDHKGDFRIMFTSVSHNRAYAEVFTIQVPDLQKQLDIELETKRSRLNPGGEEEWIVLIKDHKGNPVQAEMLASMYDGALDAIKPHNWNFALHQVQPRRFNWETNYSFTMRSGSASFIRPYTDSYFREYDQINWFGFDLNWFPIQDYRRGDIMYSAVMRSEEGMPESKAAPMADMDVKQEDAAAMEELIDAQMPQVMIRRDFRETAFFYPQLLSDASGAVRLRFTVPESLTRWRLMGFAHSADLKTGSFDESFESSREVMVVANAPRFFRQGDNMEFQAKVVNTTDKALNARVGLEMFDAVTMESVNNIYGLTEERHELVLPSNGARDIAWNIVIPVEGPVAVIYRITAIAGNHSDGEENMIPVLTNRQLLTESMPMFAGAGESRTYSLDKLSKSANIGTTATHHHLALEFTSNPVWYAVQALPYLTEPAHRNASALFHQYYANQLASYIINSNPEIERVFEVWRRTQPQALVSNLEKNQDLKSIVLEQTPWVRDALGESERKRQIAVMFQRNTINNELQKSLKDLMDMQLANGGWPWFPGMRDNRFVTQEILAGLGRLQVIGALDIDQDPYFARKIEMAINYIDERSLEAFREIKNPDDPEPHFLNPVVVQYLWARSYWLKRFPLVSKHAESFDFWKSQAEKHWTGQNLYMQGMIALALHRTGTSTVQAQIMQSFADRALFSEEAGMYWRDLRQGYNWYQAPIEAQAILIEAFATISNDMVSVEKMQQWLITQKRTQAWKSNRATAEAIYAILMRGKQTLAPNRELNIQIGNQTIYPAQDSDIRTEAGSGYFRISWHGSEILPEMANVTVNNPGNSIAWGGLYWQYFEQLDRITPHETPLKLKRSMMREVLTPSGPVLETISDHKPLSIGDKMILRIELRVDRDMEYIHMKDLRAPAFEPVEQLSGYKYQGGLGYYESPRDVATHYFFQYLPKGTWVFEYPVVVSQTGEFSSGITSIQCLYAPEFTAHSEGIRIRIE
jgi:hypothetical protein